MVHTASSSHTQSPLYYMSLFNSAEIADNKRQRYIHSGDYNDDVGGTYIFFFCSFIQQTNYTYFSVFILPASEID